MVEHLDQFDWGENDGNVPEITETEVDGASE